MTAVCELRNATWRRSGRTILDSIDFATTEGEHWVVLGPNGAGKTSLARALAGRISLDTGEALLGGEDLEVLDPSEVATRVGFVSVSIASAIRGHHSALDLVRSSAYGVSHHRGDDYEDVDERRSLDLLAAFGVDHVAERDFTTLSQGEAQRVLLARSLMTDPEVLILDEPTAGLDLGAREILIGALEEIIGASRAPQVILVTHQIEEIPVGLTHALLMVDGRIDVAGPIDEVITGVALSQAYDLPLSAGNEDGRWWARGMSRTRY